MTTIPRPRQTQDHELLVMARVCDLLATLSLEARARVIGYVNQRVDTLPSMAAEEEAAGPVNNKAATLFDPAAIDATAGG